MRLIDNIPRQPTLDDLAACDAEVTLWTARYREAIPASAWGHTCAGIVGQWREMREELAAALGGDVEGVAGTPPRDRG